jgi:hypothetical protein
VTRRLPVAVAAVAGVVVGVVGGNALLPGGGVATPEATTTSTTTATTSPSIAEPPASDAEVLLVWSPGGLPPDLGDRLRRLPDVDAVAVVTGDVVGMTGSRAADGTPVDEPPTGHRIPLDAVGIDCDGAGAVLPDADAAAICGLGDDEALLGETSARLRRLDEGGTIDLAVGVAVRVAGVVADEAVGAAELVLSPAGAARAGVRVERYALVRHGGERPTVEVAVREAAGDVPLRVRAPGETPWFRHGDAVLPQALVKERFGEFSARLGAGGSMTLDAGWTRAAIVTEEVPLLGRVSCHRDLLPALRGALAELEEAGIVTGVDRSASGCFNPRSIAGTDQPSRHAWGIAVDLVGTPIDSRTVAVMDRWGFTWGGHWLRADPMHFEYVQPPE